MFDIRDVEILREIVRWGGFRAAAGRLNLTQSAVSARVAGIEARLGVKLFDRARRGARLTPEGRAFIEQAERLVSLRNRIVASIAPGAGPAGTLRIGVAETIVHTWLAGMLTRLRERLPGLRLELSVETSPVLAARLAEGELDVAVMMRPLVPPALPRRVLYDCPLGWFSAPDAEVGQGPLSLAALAAHPLLTFSRGTLPHAELERRLAATEMDAPLIHACASLSTTLHLTRVGFGLGLLPVPMAARDLARGGLRQLATGPDAEMTALSFDFSWTPGQRAELVEALQQAAEEAIAGLPNDQSERSL